MRRLAQIATIVLDLLILGIVVAAIVIVITGGGQIHLGQIRISARSPDNPLIALAVLLAARYTFRTAVPFLANSAWPLESAPRAASDLLRRFERACAGLSFERCSRLVLIIAIAAVLLKGALAWSNPGFFSGDDVEVQEMSLRALYHTTWPIWDLRNPSFPLGVVYPAQRAAVLLGAQQTGTVVWAGRFAIATLSSFAIWLLWIAGSRRWREPGWAVIACVIFASSRLRIAFGSSELPRPVSTVLVIGGYLMLEQPGVSRAVASGVLLGIAASLRFSEAIFLVPAALQLSLQRRPGHAAALVLAGVATIGSVLALTDYWYWGRPFHSLSSAFDYTIVRGLSSRGYQSVGWYLLHFTEWANPGVFACAIAGAVLGFRERWIELTWAAVPLALLSALPHKEARYVIPLLPFVALLAAAGLRELCGSGVRLFGRARSWGPPMLVGTLALGFLFDAGHWRLPRSNADVILARGISRIAPEHLVIEQAWRMGGPLYLQRHDVNDVDPAALSDPHYIISILPRGGWGLLDSRRPYYGRATVELATAGYTECRPTWESTYRIWVPAGSACAGISTGRN